MFLYDLGLIFLFLFHFPKVLYHILFTGKYRKRLFAPNPKGTGIWIHAVSMGETKAAYVLYLDLKKQFPHERFFISTTTETGAQEAKRLMPEVEHFYLPFDFSWTIWKLLRHFHPKALHLVEGDFWLNLFKGLKKRHIPIHLISGKLSLRSYKRFKKVPFYSRKLFSCIDSFSVQSEEDAKRFVKLGAHPVQVGGNIKFRFPIQPLLPEEREKLRAHLKLGTEKIIVIGSTHEGEEKLLLDAIHASDTKILLVPRHPERFAKVRPLCDGAYSEPLNGSERIILIDAMGILTKLYQIADLAIVAGSFIPGIGGHNILEPIQLGIPTLYGPHMEAQKSLLAGLKEGEGKQINLQDIHAYVHSAISAR